jgi:3-deoxy-D-arabino-heptulosonate 7-phosphate (DAHP) synthase class II
MSRLGGVSLEFTGEFNEEGYSVTECLGGSMELSEEELGLRYQVRIMTPIILRVNLFKLT